MSHSNLRLIIHGVTNDSGGEGTLESLAGKLRSDPNLTCAKDFVFASCSLHNLQTALRNGIKDVVGEGGKKAGTNEYVKMQYSYCMEFTI